MASALVSCNVSGDGRIVWHRRVSEHDSSWLLSSTGSSGPWRLQPVATWDTSGDGRQVAAGAWESHSSHRRDSDQPEHRAPLNSHLQFSDTEHDEWNGPCVMDWTYVVPSLTIYLNFNLLFWNYSSNNKIWNFWLTFEILYKRSSKTPTCKVDMLLIWHFAQHSPKIRQWKR